MVALGMQLYLIRIPLHMHLLINVTPSSDDSSTGDGDILGETSGQNKLHRRLYGVIFYNHETIVPVWDTKLIHLRCLYLRLTLDLHGITHWIF
jgi:hypothetical protein